MPDITVQVFDGILGRELTLPLVDGNYAVANFPARYSYVVPNPYGNDTPLPPTGLPAAPSTLLAFELTTVLDSVLNQQVTMQQIDAISAVKNFPSRFSWVSGAPVGGTYDPRYQSASPTGIQPSTPHDPIVIVFDGILGKEISVPLVDGNYAVANFPARYSYVIPNSYGNDSPLPPTGLPTTSTLLVFELTVIFDNVLNAQTTVQQIDAIFATQKYPSRFSYVSGAPVPPVPQAATPSTQGDAFILGFP